MRLLTKTELALFSGFLGSAPGANEIQPSCQGTHCWLVVFCVRRAKAEERAGHRAYNTGKQAQTNGGIPLSLL